jgi:hypothetical protein
MDFFGRKLTKKEILSKIGDISQFGGVKFHELSDGTGRSLRAVDIKSPSGLDMSILLDRGMDISSMFYRSIPICWRSATGDISPVFYESRGEELLRTFYGGLLLTCGLTYMGKPTIDKGEELGLHGRVSNLSAKNVYADGKWENDDYIMWAQGKVREAKVLGDKLELFRKISTSMSVPKIIIEDTVSNLGFTTSPIMILYHINIGYPILDKTSKLIEGKAIVKPRDGEAEKGFNEYYKFSDPTPGFKEQVFFHDIVADTEGNSNVAIVNKEFNNSTGIGIALKYRKDTLPNLIQCKQLGIGEYYCGIEPSNSFPRGRDIERKEGTLKFIEPGEEINYRIEIKILESNKEIDIFERNLGK